jgi:hypothetical protein
VYDEFARLYGPPQGTFDADWVTRLLRQRRPALPEPLARQLVAHTWRHLWASPQLSRADLTGYLALDEPAVPDADLEAAVDAAIDFCDAYDVEPPRTGA